MKKQKKSVTSISKKSASKLKGASSKSVSKSSPAVANSKSKSKPVTLKIIKNTKTLSKKMQRASTKLKSAKPTPKAASKASKSKKIITTSKTKVLSSKAVLTKPVLSKSETSKPIFPVSQKLKEKSKLKPKPKRTSNPKLSTQNAENVDASLNVALNKQTTPVFKVVKLGISTGGIRVVVLPKIQVARMSLRAGDRVKLYVKPNSMTKANAQFKTNSNAKTLVAILDIATHNIAHDEIGFFEESATELKVDQHDLVRIEPYPKPEAVFLIQKKLHGHHLTKDDMLVILRSIINYELTDVELTYFVSACYHHELTNKEIASLTEAMIETGNPINFQELYPNRPIVDKHCIGGVAANRTTALVVPILAAAGYIVPKTSSRSITSPAGTSDTLEVLTDVCLNRKKIKDVVKKANCCMVWGGALDLAPSDDMIIRVENPISLDPVGQMIASILAKKKSVGSTHVLIDIPVGVGAKIQSQIKALSLKKKFEEVGSMLGMKVLVIITDGSQPIGNGIGPALEARDILWTLANDARGSAQLKKKAIEVSARLFTMLENLHHHEAVEKAKELLESKQAYAVFVTMLKAQGLAVESLEPSQIEIGKFTYTHHATQTGKITHMDNRILSRIAKLAGAPFDKKAGMYLHVHNHDPVKVGDAIYTIYASDPVVMERVKSHIEIETGVTIKAHLNQHHVSNSSEK
jgi:putative thymidine phosphorylase